jgi:hypothetical protein
MGALGLTELLVLLLLIGLPLGGLLIPHIESHRAEPHLTRRRQKEFKGFGIGLTVFGYLLLLVEGVMTQRKPQGVLAAVVTLTAILSVVMGCSLIAVGKGRSVLWGLYGLLGCIGLVVIAFLKSRVVLSESEIARSAEDLASNESDNKAQPHSEKVPVEGTQAARARPKAWSTRRLVLVSASAGAGFALVILLVVGAVLWQKGQSRSWNSSAITAISVSANEVDKNVFVRYRLNNATTRDYRADQLNVMLKLKDDSLLEDSELQLVTI